MPRLSRWLVRASLLHLLGGTAAGAIMLASRGARLDLTLRHLWPAHAEMLWFGWTVQLVLGVAFWILPRFPTNLTRGHEAPVWAAFILLNSGVVLAAVGHVPAASAALALAGRALELFAVAAFIVHAWPRIRVGLADSA